MRARRQQAGATLVMGMVMLTLVTLLVVYAIRAGNTNLRIAGNMQTQTEAQWAAQQAIEQLIEQIRAVDSMSLIPAQTITVNSAGATYAVSTLSLGTPGACLMEVPVVNADLDPTRAEDVQCFESQDADKAIRADGTLSTAPSACKQQHWELQASVNDPTSGAQVTQVQGISIRVPATVSCP